MNGTMQQPNTPAAPGAGTETERPEEHIHMPSPSFSPIILALGLAILVFGLAFGIVPVVIGAVLTVIGLGTWIYDDIRSASAQSSHEHGK